MKLNFLDYNIGHGSVKLGKIFFCQENRFIYLAIEFHVFFFLYSQ